MILVNTDYIEGRKFEMIGLVKGSMIQSVHVGKDIVNSFKTLVGLSLIHIYIFKEPADS